MIFPGYVSGDVIEGAYCGANAFFFPSKEETEGIVVLEALASYQKVIIRDIPVFEPWLINNVNCYKGKTVEDFTYLVKNAVEENLPDVRKNGRKTAEERSIESIGLKLREVYEKVLYNS